MEQAALKLRYRSLEQLRGHLLQLTSGRIFIPTEIPLPALTFLKLTLILPDRSGAITLDAQVLESIDRRQAADLRRPAGMSIGVVGGSDAALAEVERKIDTLINPAGRDAGAAVGARAAPDNAPGATANPTTAAPPRAGPARPSRRTGPPPGAEAVCVEAAGQPPARLSMDWIRKAVAQKEAAREPAATAAAVVAGGDRKELTAAERNRIKPAGDFVMDLTKAMLRTGYYAPDHPGSRNAKRGLFEAFRKCLGDSEEIMITLQETREKTDILITGILEEPVSVRILVGAGMAELFVPKLRDYFNRKALVSFAVKKQISAEHFEQFVTVMSDPAVDRGENTRVGEGLTSAIASRGITGISMVFQDDIIVLEKNLPWRVEMAIQRLAKDLKVLPMFQGESDAAIRQMKLQIIQDILRPLKHPEFLKDLIVNCYVIAQHVTNIQEEDIEQVIIDAFPLNTLLPTSIHIFKELGRLREIEAREPGSPAVARRFAGVKRILKWVSRRLVLADVRGAQGFLEDLHANGILSFEELPEDVQYLVNTQEMARDIAGHIRAYLERLLKPPSPGDGRLILQCFRRVVPSLLDQGDARTVLWIAKGVRAAAARQIVPATPETGADLIGFVFRQWTDVLQSAYERCEGDNRRDLDAVLGTMGELGIEVLCQVLSDSEHREARKAAMNALIQHGALARDWTLAVLEDPSQKWFLKRNALMLLRHVASGKEDLDVVRRLADHTHARVRDEALATLVALKAPEAEALAVNALDDPDDKIRWRAAGALADLAPLSREAMGRILERLHEPPPEDKELAARHQRKIAQLLRAVGGMERFAEPEQVEAAVLEVARRAAGLQRSLLQRLRKASSAEEEAVAGAALLALGAVGSSASEAFLAGLADGKSAHAAAAAKALESLRGRRA